MKWQNKVQLIGYMGLDPAIKELPSGGKVAIIRLATHTLFQKPNGEPSRTTAWHTVKLWGDRAERVATNFIKGSHVLVDGRLVYRNYPDKTGHTRFVTEINADLLLNLDR